MAIFTPIPSSVVIRERLAEARAAETSAAADLKAAYVAEDEAAEALATAKINAARRDIAKHEAILVEAGTREGIAAAKAEKARQAAQDAAVRQAFEAQAKAAAALEKATKGYASAYGALIAAGDAARKAAGSNPRIRSDLRAPNIAVLVSHEIARQAATEADWLLPPGAIWPSASRDPKSVTPLATQFESLAAAILPSP
jgi:hypothetical protein